MTTIPEPSPEQTHEPTHEPSPEPIHEPSPEPIHEPSPEPIHEPSPEPIHEPSPEPTHELDQELSNELSSDEVNILRLKCKTLEDTVGQLSSHLALQETALGIESTLNNELQYIITNLNAQYAETQGKITSVTSQMTEKVQITDQYIRDLLSQLLEGQEKYDKLKNEKCQYCPWTWISQLTKEPNWMYGVVGLIFIIGGSRAI